MLEIRDCLYSLPGEKISFITQNTIPGKQSNPFTRQNKIIKIIIKKIQQVFYKKTNSQKSKNSRKIFPDNIFLQNHKKNIQNKQKKKGLKKRPYENTRIMSDNRDNVVYCKILFDNLLSQHTKQVNGKNLLTVSLQRLGRKNYAAFFKEAILFSFSKNFSILPLITFFTTLSLLKAGWHW